MGISVAAAAALSAGGMAIVCVVLVCQCAPYFMRREPEREPDPDLECRSAVVDTAFSHPQFLNKPTAPPAAAARPMPTQQQQQQQQQHVVPRVRPPVHTSTIVQAADFIASLASSSHTPPPPSSTASTSPLVASVPEVRTGSRVGGPAPRLLISCVVPPKNDHYKR